MIFNSFAILNISATLSNLPEYWNFDENAWTLTFDERCLAPKWKADDLVKHKLAGSGQLQEINVSAVEASCGYCEHFNDIAHNCEYYHAVGTQQKKIESLIAEITELKHTFGPGYMQDEIEFSDKVTYLEKQLARAYELIKRGTKQSVEGLLEGIKYDNDVRAFLKDYELREGIKNNKENI